MQLRDHPDIGAALPVDRDQRLDGDLKGASNPDDAGIDGARRHRSRGECVRHRRLHRCLNQRDQMIDELRQAEVDHRGLQIGHAVLNRSPPVQHARMELGVDGLIAGIRIDAEGRCEVSGRNRIADLARDRDRPDPR